MAAVWLSLYEKGHHQRQGAWRGVGTVCDANVRALCERTRPGVARRKRNSAHCTEQCISHMSVFLWVDESLMGI